MSDPDEKPTTISDIRNDDSLAVKADLSSLPEVDPAYYTLGKEVGRGGMGRVMEARDLRVGRSVVLKELLEESPSHALRFEREARVTARLQHPAIVPIYEIGKWPDGAPFYAMRMVEGRNLRTAITEARELDARLALLPSVIVAAEAIAYAHAHRVIHRDLKPSNIMIGDFGETIVIDWGLAKDLGDGAPEADEVGPYRGASTGELTLVGAVVGTPAYMPPEQARGEAVDERGDVYSLGAILYHLLSGEPPFRGGKSEDLLEAVKTAAPAAIEELAREAPRDLLSIVDKAMARDPAARYSNAAELVAELVQFRTGQLVGAHRYSRRELMRRWLRDHRLLVIAAGTALAALAITGTLAIVGVVRERDRADSERATAIEQRAKATDTTLALYEEQGRREVLDGDPAIGLAYLHEAYRQGRDTPALRVLLAEALDRAGARTPLPCRAAVTSYTVSPDSTRVAIACGTVSVYELATAKRLFEIQSTGATRDLYSHDGRTLLTIEAEGDVWDANTGTHKFGLASGARLVDAWFTQDDQRIITVSTTGWIRVWNATTGHMVKSTALGILEREVQGADHFNADRVVVLSASGQLDIWDPFTGVHMATAQHGDRAQTFSARGDKIVTCGNSLKVWTATGKLLREVRFARGVIRDCKLTPDGNRIVFPFPNSAVVEVEDAKTGEILLQLVDRSLVRHVVVAPDGAIYTLNLTDLAMWNATNGELLRRIDVVDPHMQAAQVRSSLILVAGGLATLTPIVAPMHMFTTPPHERTMNYSPDGSRILTRRDDGTTTLWDADTGLPVPTQPIHHYTRQSEDAFSIDEPQGSVFTTDSKRLAIVRDNDIAIIDPTSGNTIDVFPPVKSMPALEFDRAGRRLLVGAPAPAVWDLSTHRNLLGPTIVDAITISLDGRLALVVDGHDLKIFDLDRGSVRTRLVGTGESRVSAGFSGDGTRIEVDLASGPNQGAVVGIWSVDTGRLLASFPAIGRVLSNSRDLLAATTNGRLELRRFFDATIVRSVQLSLANDISVFTVPDDNGQLGVRESDIGGSIEVVDLATGRVLTRRGHDTEADRLVRRYDGTLGGIEEADLAPAWVGNDAVLSARGGVSVWRVRSEHRSPGELDPIVRSSIPWRIKDGRLVVEYTRLSGRVTSHGHPVAGARVAVVTMIWQMPYVSDTDANGMYSFDELPPGEYLVHASTDGRTSSEHDVALSYTTARVENLDVP